MIAAAVLVAALPLAQGCATDRAGEPGPDQEPTGEMVISLTQPGPHGEITGILRMRHLVLTPAERAVRPANSNAPIERRERLRASILLAGNVS